MNYKYKFTVFTPCYNSEKFIHRVYDSLMNQTMKNFEWLIINDGSTDNTRSLLLNYIKSAEFDVKFFDFEENQMLTKNYNIAFENAEGEFFLPLGHDDALVDNALEKFIEYWEKIDMDERKNFSGVVCTCVDQNGDLIGDKFPSSPFISDFFETVYKLKIKGEKTGMFFSDVIKKYRIPEIDTYVPESLLWHQIGADYKSIYVNESLRIYYINQPHVSLSSTSTRKIKYAKGKRYFLLCLINDFYSKIEGNLLFKLKTILNYGRLSIHIKAGILKSLKDINKFFYRLIFFIFLPITYSIIIRDRLKKYI